MTIQAYNLNGGIAVSVKCLSPDNLRKNFLTLIQDAKEVFGKRIIEMTVKEDNVTFEIKLKRI